MGVGASLCKHAYTTESHILFPFLVASALLGLEPHVVLGPCILVVSRSFCQAADCLPFIVSLTGASAHVTLFPGRAVAMILEEVTKRQEVTTTCGRFDGGVLLH